MVLLPKSRSPFGLLCFLILLGLPAISSGQVIDDFEQGTFNLSGTSFASATQSFLLPIHCISTDRVDRMFINGNPSGADLNLTGNDDEVTTVWGDGGGRLEFDYFPAAVTDLTFGGTANSLRVVLSIAVPAGRLEITLSEGDAADGVVVSRTITGSAVYNFALPDFAGVDAGSIAFIQLALDVPDFGDYHIRDFRAFYDPAVAAGMDVTVGTALGPPYPTSPIQIVTYGQDASGRSIPTGELHVALQEVSAMGASVEAELTAADSGGGVGSQGEQVGIIIVEGAPPAGLPPQTVRLGFELVGAGEYTSLSAFPPTFIIDDDRRSVAMEFASYSQDSDGVTQFRNNYFLGLETSEGSGLSISNVAIDLGGTDGGYFDVAIDLGGTDGGVPNTVNVLEVDEAEKQGESVVDMQLNVESFEFATATAVPGWNSHGSMAVWAQPNVMSRSTRLYMSHALDRELRLCLFDLGGRSVRTVTVPAGQEFAVWDGRDAHGVPVASGVYLLRAMNAPGYGSAKVVMVR